MLEMTRSSEVDAKQPDEPALKLTENARTVLMKRYVRRGPDGKPIETPEGMFRRIAHAIAEPEAAHGGDVAGVERAFYRLLTDLRFFPNSPTFTGAGTPLGQLAACFVIPISDDMGRKGDGIFQTLRDAALIQQTGGGNGFAFSRLRPKGGLVKSSAGHATGPVGFLRVYDKAFGEIAQGGCLLPETLVFTERGLLRLDEIADSRVSGWQPHTLRVATDEGWRTSPRAYNNGVASVLRVHTRQGLSLAGTPEHRVKVMTDQGPEWRTLQDLRPDDWILVKMGQHRGKFQALRQPRRSHGNQVWPKLPSVLDEELGFFLGYLTGDGFVASQPDDHRVGVSVSHTSYLLSEMPALLERLFGVTLHRQQKSNDRSVTFTMDNRAVKEFLQLNSLDKLRSREARVPRLIRQSPPEVVGAYLRGLFEADGSLSHGYPALTTTSSRLAEEVATLLIGLGCPVRVWSAAPGVAHWGQAQLYHVRIESGVGLQAWRERIGCDPRSRFVAAHAWESDQRRESTYPLPAPRYWLQPVLDAITLEQVDARAIGRKFRSQDPRLRRALLRYLRGERQFTRSAYDELCQTFPEFAAHARSPEGFWFVKVSGVEPVGEALTLDLEVDDNHTYLAYGMLTHNTRRGANMAVLRVDHPDVEEFITCKTDEKAITNFNISVGITDAFMEAVKRDGEWELRFPDVKAPEYSGFNGTLEEAERAGIPIKVHKRVRARELFDKIVKQAHHNGEPGVLFLDAANRSNPVPHLYQLEATNPCFVGSTRIATNMGLIPVQEMAESGTAFLVATDGRAPYGGRGLPVQSNFGVAFRSSLPAWKTRMNVPVIRLITKHGYVVTATPDHKFLTSDRGHVELQDLKPGDRLLLQSGEGAWSTDYGLPNVERVQELMTVMGRGGDRASGALVTRRDFAARYADLPAQWSHDLGLVVGWLVGDGWLSPESNSPLGMVFAANNIEVREIVHGAMRQWFGSGHLHDRGSVSQLTYGRLPYEFFSTLGVLPVPAYEKRVPESIWRAPREAVIGFLQGLFTADGTVNVSSHKKSCNVRLASSSRALLGDVQLLLLNLGIVSRIHFRRAAGTRRLPDGKGGYKNYFTHADYELIIDKVNRDRFVEVVGFIEDDKQRKVSSFITSKARRSNAESFESTVVSIESAGQADVYDLTEPQTHSVIANGIVAHQCGEQYLGSYENCCLGSINLAQHVKYVNGRAEVDWAKLEKSSVLSTHFLDNVVTANQYVPAVPQLKEAAYRARRIGLGIMGLGDMMYHLGIRYGSPEGQEFSAQIMEFVRYHCMKTSISLAKERGPFLAIEGSIYDPKNLKWTPPKPLEPYTRDWGRPAIEWNEIVEGIQQHGIRNAAQTTVAPTGCLVAGMLVATDRGLLPIETLGDPHGAHWQDVDVNVASEGGARPATQFYVNGRAQTLRVTTRRGYVMQGTDGHRIRIWESGEWVWRRMDELRPGMIVPLQATGLVGQPQRVLLDTHVVTDFHASPITLPGEMTPDLAYLIGFFMGDGSLKERTLRFSVSDPALRDRLIELLQNVFGLKSLVSKDNRSPNLESLEAHSLNLVEFWRRNGFAKLLPDEGHSGKGYRPHVPLAVLRANDAEVYAAFLAGLFDADATLHKQYLLSWQTTNRLFHDQVKAMLLALGVLTTSDLQTTGLGQSIAYRLRTAHAEAALHMVRQLPYLCRLILSNGHVRRHTLHDTIPLTAEETRILLSAAGSESEHWRAWAWRQRQRASRESLRAFVGEHRVELVAAGLHTVVKAIEQPVFYDEIQTVEDGGWQQTYDLSVPTTHAYVANGFISHNTIATVAGCEAYGCEPVFALAYLRHVIDAEAGGADGRTTLTYGSPLFEQALIQAGVDEQTRQRIYADVLYTGTCQNVEGVPESVRHTFVVSADITPEEHVRMQAALQVFVDNSLSKTVNFPAHAAEEDVATAYMLAWELGCKGITVYVTGSRDKVVLETKQTKSAKEKPAEAAPVVEAHVTKKPRPRKLVGSTFKVGTPLGTAFITINENGDGRPFEVFLNVGKAGSDTAAVAEALGRLISLVLRLPSPMSSTERLQNVIEQLAGIGGGRPMGFGTQRVRSLPDGVAQALIEYLGQAPASSNDNGDDNGRVEVQSAQQLPLKIGDLCPDCGEASVVNEEGCRKCYSCGYSEC